MESKLARLKSLLAEATDLATALSLLGWDQQVNMPPGGAEGRSYQISTLEKVIHEKMTSSEIGALLDEVQPYVEQLDPDSDDARLVKVIRRDYEKRIKVPADLVAEFAQVTSLGQQVWQTARAENNFAKFQPYLEQIFELRRRYADCFAPYDHVYDPLLDDYEPGLKTSEVKAIFDGLRPQQVALIQSIAEQPQVDNSFLYQPFDEATQWDFGVSVITKFGYDWQRGRQDKSVHPFTQEFGMNDVRITTRINPTYLGSALFGTMHEAGHALYEQGVDPALARTPMAHGASYAMHESQSRMWENFVGRSLAFWEHFYPQLYQVFPEQLKGVSLGRFYKGINKVKPSLIRVEADEATYNMHIMLRLELEIELAEGSLAVKDLPEAWNARMEEYLGVTPPDDAQGLMQDVHWSIGYIGYFSTYALGNLVAAQLWERINADIPDLAGQFRQGEFTALLSWLRSNLHRHGAKFEPQELLQRLTGSKITPDPYLRYLHNKFEAIYGL